MPPLDPTRDAAGAATPRPRLRVALVPERIGANLSPCASIRLHPYLEVLRRRGDIEYRVLFPEELERFRPDLIAWHRISVPDLKGLQDLKAVADRLGARLLYDLDDNLRDIDDHSEGDAYRHMREVVARSLLMADEVWCSTPALTARVETAATGAVHTLPNTLDPSTWRLDAAPAAGAPEPVLRLLYMGTRTHEEDFAFLSRVMARLHQLHPGEFSLTVIGIRRHDRAETPWLQVRSAPNFIGASYPGFVHWLQQQSGFDLGVAPLVESDFNACKSHIKVLDYAALGLPSVASAVPAYAHALRDGHGCRLVPNDVEAWCRVLGQLRGDRAALATLALGARALVGEAAFAAAVEARAERLQALALPPRERIAGALTRAP
jgi:glycosyltransferase involved in cell wall biosynthesis